jgi:hypothetical protein
MKKAILVITVLLMIAAASWLSAIDIYGTDNSNCSYDISQLRDLPLERFQTTRQKDGKELLENWQGINLRKWLDDDKFGSYQSIRFESSDNYMVRIHKAELDTMKGFIALQRENAMLDSTEIRVIFPAHREMYWVRGVARIYLEDFKPVPPPAQIFIWDSLESKLQLSSNPPPFTRISGFSFDDVMRKIFRMDEGSVVIASRDGLKSRLEYPRHLRGSVLEKTADNELNLKSPVIPAGMWLKDIVYIQCGPYAVLKHDFIYRLTALAKTLDWQDISIAGSVIKAGVRREDVALESLFLPGAIPLSAEEWIELP